MFILHIKIENGNTNVHHLGQGQDLCKRVYANDSCLLVLTVCTEPWINDLFVVLFKGQFRLQLHSFDQQSKARMQISRGKLAGEYK